jgi:HAD superfamily hydrolase (TIGR01509 family)
MSIKIDMKTKGYIFDLDGTLLDSNNVWHEVDVDFFANRGITFKDDWFDEIAHMSFYEVAKHTIKKFGFSDTPEQLVAEWRDMVLDAYKTRLKMKPNAAEFLKRIHANGARIALATCGIFDLYRAALQNHGVYQFFDTLCGAQDAGEGKHTPEIFLNAARRLGLKPQDCVVFEDNIVAIRTAKAAGFRVCGIYDERFSYHWEEIKSTADWAIKDYAELF